MIHPGGGLTEFLLVLTRTFRNLNQSEVRYSAPSERFFKKNWSGPCLGGRVVCTRQTIDRAWKQRRPFQPQRAYFVAIWVVVVCRRVRVAGVMVRNVCVCFQRRARQHMYTRTTPYGSESPDATGSIATADGTW